MVRAPDGLTVKMSSVLARATHDGNKDDDRLTSFTAFESCFVVFSLRHRRRYHQQRSPEVAARVGGQKEVVKMLLKTSPSPDFLIVTPYNTKLHILSQYFR